jgi:hypothetical protein
MHTWREHSDELECDYTQRIHTMEALDELLQLGCCPCSRALADETLREQVRISNCFCMSEAAPIRLMNIRIVRM